jgi:DNA-binding MarR family transcriptional regulator
MPVDPASLWTLNHRLLTVVLEACSAELGELGLETKEFFVLAEVGTSPYPAELATSLVIPRASVTVYVRNLVAKGFLRREIDDADLRRHRLVLTAEGTGARDRALAALATEFDRRLQRITAHDRGELERILRDLLEPVGQPPPSPSAAANASAGTPPTGATVTGPSHAGTHAAVPRGSS